MNPELDQIFSIINGHSFAKDKNRVFTYIEFVKMFGFDNNPDTFINQYKEYVTRWASIKKNEIEISDTEFVFSKLVEILKSITLDYSSYEEQDFIAHIDLNNKAHLKALCSIYSRKIREITEFYRKKRNEAVLTVNRNSIKGSKKSIQEIIYEKVFDFIFSNKNIVPSYKNIKRDLLVTVEQYVDTYSEYFDIPRNYEFTDETRREMLTANMNDVDYRMYLEIELVVSELLYSGNVMLEEIPLIAQLGLDLSQNCVGDMLALKNSLMANTTINQVDLNEQIALKRRLYEKFLGCDLWYLYVDLQGNVKIDVLCKAKNPTGNLLNCGNPDTATIPSEQEELLSHIGLFFKPDKTSILKINAKEYTWSVDTQNLTIDTMYIFPDPNNYGDIGNNKSNSYPLIMEYKLDWDIRNLSSGSSCDDPLMMVTDQGWRSYYSKQDDIFKTVKNTNWEYSFTYLSNRGFLSNYQVDIWGNEWGLLKGSEVTPIQKTIIGSDGTETVIDTVKITLSGKGFQDEMTYGVNDDKLAAPKILNGGYFENPLYRGYETRLEDGRLAWVYNGDENKVQPFNFNQRLILSDTYQWSGIEVYGTNLNNEQIEFSTSSYNDNFVNFGRFGDFESVQFEDHFQSVTANLESVMEDEGVIKDVMRQFLSVNLLENPELNDVEFEVKDATYEEIKQMDGDLYLKIVGQPNEKPQKVTRSLIDPLHRCDELDWWTDELKPNDFIVFGDNLILIYNDKLCFIPYSYNGYTVSENLGIREMIELKTDDCLFTKFLFNESERMFYILQLKEWNIPGTNRTLILPRIYKFDPQNYTLIDFINVFDKSYKNDYEVNGLDKIVLLSLYFQKKKEIIDDGVKLKDTIDGGDFVNLMDFEVPQFDKNGIGEVIFTHNSALGQYLISFVVMDDNGTPYLYEFKFKLSSLDDFESSLQTNVYTLRSVEEDEFFVRKNLSLTSGETYCYPYDNTFSNSNIFTEVGSDDDIKYFQSFEGEREFKDEVEIIDETKNK